MIEPPVLGAVVVIVNAAVPFCARPLVNVTVHVSNAPALDDNVPQLTADTPEPAATAVATTPAGNWSFSVTDVPEVVCPVFVIVSVFVIAPPVSTDAVLLLASVKVTGVFTVVAALAQLALVQLAPGVGGELPPVESTDA